MRGVRFLYGRLRRRAARTRFVDPRDLGGRGLVTLSGRRRSLLTRFGGRPLVALLCSGAVLALLRGRALVALSMPLTARLSLRTVLAWLMPLARARFHIGIGFG